MADEDKDVLDPTEEETDSIVDEVLARHEPEEEIADAPEETDEAVEDLEDKDTEVEDDAEDEEVSEEGGVLDPDLVARAEAYGYTQEMLKAFGTSEQLQAALVAYDRLYAASRQQQQPTPPKEEKAVEEEAEEEINLDDFDEDTKKVLEKLINKNKTLEEQTDKLYEYFQGVVALEQEKQVTEVQRRFTSAFDEIGSNLYGNGKEATKEQQAKRQEAEQTAWALLQWEINNGATTIDWKKLAERAAFATHPDDLVKERNKSRVNKVRERSAKRTSVGSRKRGSQSVGSKEKLEKLWNKPSADADFMREINEIVERQS